MAYFKFLIVLLLPLFAQGNRCGISGNWVQYKDEKCYMFVDDFVTAENALSQCLFENPSASLPVVKSVEEQKFIDDYLYLEHGVIDGVWLGATRVNSTQEFAWGNGDDMSSFSNWAPEYPSDDDTRSCARMVSSAGKSILAENGQWEDVSCASRNLVLCQKPSQYSHEELVEELLKLRFNYHESEKAHLEFKEETVAEIETLKEDLEKIIPVGFLYFQVGTQPSPVSLWPGYSWVDVSGDYAGLFFRVTGGGAGGIGTIQAENAPKLGGVRYDENPYSPGLFPKSISVPSSGWSSYVYSGLNTAGSNPYSEGLSFEMTNNVEVRPKNTAMRVWKRI